MIVVTGGAGFIGSAIVWKLNMLGKTNIVIVDELGKDEKWKNLVGLKYENFVNKIEFIEQVIDDVVPYNIEAIIHMGANSSTTEKDADHLIDNNYNYTKELAQYSLEKNIRFVYASSAATYGDGMLGFNDDERSIETLRPLNMYGYTKHLFDLWASRNKVLDRIVGLKYFNVFGPNEYHKGDMRSVVHKAFEQIKSTGRVRLFKSENPKFKDGEQMRDFIYVKDAVDITIYFLENPEHNGIYNVGSGKARAWKDLAASIFNALEKPLNIEYIDLPPHLTDKYQYFTEARLDRLRSSGYKKELTSLEDGIKDYVKNYLLKNAFLE